MSKQIIRTVPLAILFLFVTACVSDNVLSQHEVEIQNKAAAIVAGILFEHDLDDSASYNVRKNGYVIILFDDNVSAQQYTEVVNLLRSNTDIKGVRAEQFGVEVCGLP